jgi:hypothetical protein
MNNVKSGMPGAIDFVYWKVARVNTKNVPSFDFLPFMKQNWA